jgi:hypothetical protein
VRFQFCWSAVITVLITPASVLAEVTDWPPPLPPLNTTQQHCSPRDMCPAGVACSTGLAGTEPSATFRRCADKAIARGCVSRCSFPYEGGGMLSVLFCPRGQSGAWPGSLAIAQAELEPPEAGVASATDVGPPASAAQVKPPTNPSNKGDGADQVEINTRQVSHPPQKARSASCVLSRFRVQSGNVDWVFLTLGVFVGAMRRKAQRANRSVTGNRPRAPRLS